MPDKPLLLPPALNDLNFSVYFSTQTRGQGHRTAKIILGLGIPALSEINKAAVSIGLCQPAVEIQRHVATVVRSGLPPIRRHTLRP